MVHIKNDKGLSNSLVLLGSKVCNAITSILRITLWIITSIALLLVSDIGKTQVFNESSLRLALSVCLVLLGVTGTIILEHSRANMSRMIETEIKSTEEIIKSMKIFEILKNL